MLSVSQAEATILNLIQPLNPQLDTETVDLLTASGRILAKPVTSQLDFPHWDNSAMDGYAVRYQDVQHTTPDQPTILEIVEEIPAGYQPQTTIQPGQAARIFTGAIIPTGADTIVIQERTQRQANQVTILAPPQPQEFVRHRASYYQAGLPLLPAGIRLNAPEIAVLAAAQCQKISVYRKPRVAIFSTGDELVTPDQQLQPGQIVDSNNYALHTLIVQSGAEPLMLGIVKDNPEALAQAIAQAITKADIIISSGGVSVGDYDYVEQILTTLGAEIHIRAVAIKPGKPLTVATFPQLYFGLPGNPVSALVTFWRFVEPAIAKLSGISSGWEPQFIKARSRLQLRADGKRETYIWGQLHLVDGTYEFQLADGNNSSGNLINLAQTNALGILRVNQTRIERGEEVLVLKRGGR